MKKLKTLFVILLIFILLIPFSAFAAEKDSTTFTFYFRNIVTTSGKFIEELNVGTAKVSQGTTASKAQKWFDNKMQGGLYYAGTYQGVEYEFNGTYLDENGAPVSFPLVMEYGAEKTSFYLYPQYNQTPVTFLDFKYTDNISTGTGSWKNVDGFTEYTHTFATPDPQEGYEFVIWKDIDTEEEYGEGDQYSCKIEDIPVGETKEVNIYAVWQPSVTVNWYVDEELYDSVESFDNAILAYDVIPELEEDQEFVEWKNEEEVSVDKEVSYSVPEQTIEAVDRKVINLYAAYETTPPPPAPGETTPTPTPTPTVTPTPTPKPTVTPTPTPKPTVTPKPTPVPTTPTPTPKPEPTNTPDPTPEPTVKPTPTPVDPVDPITPIDPTPAPTQEPIPPTPVDPTPVVPTPIEPVNPTNPIVTPTNTPEEEYQDILEPTVKPTTKPKINPVVKVTTTPDPTPTPTPKVIEIEEDDPPLAAPKRAYWALLNLLLTILSIVISVFLIILSLRKLSKEDNENEETEKQEKKAKGRLIKTIISIVISIILCIIFIFTEDMRNIMTWIDFYTFPMMLLVLVQTLVLVLFKHQEEKDDTEESE